MHVVKCFRSNRRQQENRWSWKVESKNSHRLSCVSSASGDMGVNQRHHLQKASAACEGSTSSLVSRINKRAFFFFNFFSPSQKPAQFFIFLFTKQEEILRKKHSMFISKPAWHGFLWQMESTRARFQIGRNRGASQPLSIHEGIPLSAGIGLNGSGIFAFGSGGFLDTALPPPPTSCANKA